MTARAATACLVLAFALASCRGGGQAPEPGAVLLALRLTSDAPAPNELRLWVYDDTGALWSDVRFPSAGTLAPPHGHDLGTILIQPGAATGRLRVHARALAGGVRVLDGTLVIAPGIRAATTALELDASLPEDGDGDGVPDDIDDCASAPNPAQGGCAIDSDGGADAATESTPDAATTDDGGGCDGPCGQPAGAACGLDADCLSGFCTDGVCCPEACTNPCFSCATGSCAIVKNRADAPQCIAPMTCNTKGKCVGGG